MTTRAALETSWLPISSSGVSGRPPSSGPSSRTCSSRSKGWQDCLHSGPSPCPSSQCTAHYSSTSGSTAPASGGPSGGTSGESSRRRAGVIGPRRRLGGARGGWEVRGLRRGAGAGGFAVLTS